MKINPKKYLGYSDIFEGSPESIEYYLEGIDRETMFLLIPFLVNASTPDHQFHSPFNLLPEWFSGENQEYCYSILEKFDTSSIFVNPISSLELVEIAYSIEAAQTKTKSDVEIERDIFILYSILNQRQNKLEIANEHLLPAKGDANYHNALFTQYTFNTSDLLNVDLLKILCCQIYKTTQLLKYFEKSQKHSEHYEIFLSKYKSTDWQEYLKKLYALTLPVLVSKDDKSFHQVNVDQDANYDANCSFLEQFILSETDNYTLQDFIAIRENPLYKIDEGKYRVVNKQFLIEKIFKSLTFMFWLEINNKLVSDQNKIADFKGQFGEEFSENTLLYKVLDDSFPNKWIKISGQDFKNLNYDKGEPDYYLRFKNKILLFESKDVIIKGEIKQSRNHQKIIKALADKFNKTEENGRGVGIPQIVKNIKRIMNKHYEYADVDYNSETIRIFPILLVHDKQYDTLAFNKILNEWFQDELDGIKDECNISKVEKLTLINIDTFIYYRDIIKNGKVIFDQIITKYHSKANKLISFNHFAENEIDKFMSSPPEYLEKMIREVQ